MFFIDPFTLKACEITINELYNKDKPLSLPLFKSHNQLEKYTVLDISFPDVKENGGYKLADVQICKTSLVGVENSIKFVKTHLGNIIQVGDEGILQ
jgi:hypothetical protein